MRVSFVLSYNLVFEVNASYTIIHNKHSTYKLHYLYSSIGFLNPGIKNDFFKYFGKYIDYQNFLYYLES